MRIITTIKEAYKFAELTDEAKEKAVENLYDINTDFEWWESTYEDAKEAGLKLTGFDIDRGSYCKGDFITTALNCAELIVKNHGETCEAYQTALNFIKDRAALAVDDGGDFVDEDAADELVNEFKKSLLEDYLMMLRNEYEYKTSREAIIETIEANEYEFTKEGKLI